MARLLYRCGLRLTMPPANLVQMLKASATLSKITKDVKATMNLSTLFDFPIFIRIILLFIVVILCGNCKIYWYYF
jgi:hypothetical protein